MAKKELLKSADCRCPNCKHFIVYGEGGTFISSTEKEFCQAPDPHFKWVETHQCKSCETIFTLENGT